MKKKAKKQAKPTPQYDSGRETRVLLEKMRSEIKAIGEGHGVLLDKIEKIDNTVRELNSTSFKTEMNIEGIKSKVGTVDAKLDRIEKEVGSVKMAILDVSSTMKDHEKRLQKVESVSH